MLKIRPLGYDSSIYTYKMIEKENDSCNPKQLNTHTHAYLSSLALSSEDSRAHVRA